MLSLSFSHVKTVRTEVIEFMQSPFGGTPLSECAWTVKDISDAIGRPQGSVRRALNGLLARGDARRAWFRGTKVVTFWALTP
jgi:hypothetical protein